MARDWHQGLLAFCVVAAFSLGFFGNLIAQSVASDAQIETIAHEKVKSLEELGYDEVTLDRYGSYIASKDGEFVRLYLESNGNRTYEVLEGTKLTDEDR